jgi:hypothetical protein
MLYDSIVGESASPHVFNSRETVSPGVMLGEKFPLDFECGVKNLPMYWLG